MSRRSDCWRAARGGLLVQSHGRGRQRCTVPTLWSHPGSMPAGSARASTVRGCATSVGGRAGRQRRGENYMVQRRAPAVQRVAVADALVNGRRGWRPSTCARGGRGPQRRRPWCSGGCGDIGMSEDSGDGGEQHTGGDRGDAEGVSKAFWAGLGSRDAGAVHDGDDASVSGSAGPGPDRFGGAARGDAAQPVDEFEGAQLFCGERDLAPVVCSTLETSNADRLLLGAVLGRRSAL